MKIGNRIWQFSDPDNFRFARAGRRGTWDVDSEGIERRVRPLILEWLPSSDVVGDFVWPGLNDDLVVVERVASGLKAQFSGFELHPVEMFQEERLYHLKRKPRHPRVLLPYEGPTLHDVRVTKVVGLDLERSTLKRTVNDDGKITYEAEGLEEYGSRWNPATLDLSHFHVPREEGKGLYVRSDDLIGCDLFHIKEFLGFKYCTGKVRDYVEGNGFTNVRFREVGEII